MEGRQDARAECLLQLGAGVARAQRCIPDVADAFRSRILPALHNFAPDLVIISAGFDAHKDDPLANLRLVEADFLWVTEELAKVADRHCRGRIVSMLEGGYDLTALARSVAVHVKALMDVG